MKRRMDVVDMLKENANVNGTSPALEPLRPEERIDAIDVLRGFAMFGVLIAYACWNLGGPPPETYGAFDAGLDLVLAALVDTKAYTLLAFLFGLGFSIQMLRAEARGGNITRLYSRRLLALAAIGVLHALLLRNGDILVPYAAAGFVLLLVRDASRAVLVLIAIVAVALPYLGPWLAPAAGLELPARPDTTGLGYFAANFAWVRFWYTTGLIYWPGSLPMFFCGLVVGRNRVFENPDGHAAGIRRVLWWGLAVGAGAYALRFAVEGAGPSYFAALTMIWKLHAWGLAAFYACSAVLLSRREAWRKLTAPLAAVGRMALTNYLLQSILINPVAVAFGLFDRVTPSLGLGLALAVFAIQVPASVWWLRRFRYGPAEWLWRSLTYGRRQPMRNGDLGRSAERAEAVI